VTPVRLERTANGLKGHCAVDDLNPKVCTNRAMFLSTPV